MSRRRTVVSGIGSSISVSAMVFGVDLHQAVAAVAGDPRAALGVDLDAVGPRVRRRHGHEPDLAGRRVEPAHHVALLQGEPEDAVGSKTAVCGSFAAGSGILYSVTSPVSGIELADRAVLVARVPDVAGAIEGHGVRHGARRAADIPSSRRSRDRSGRSGCPTARPTRSSRPPPRPDRASAGRASAPAIP